MRRLFLLLPFLLPAYVLRLQLGPLPTTVLELGMIALTLTWLITRKTDGLKYAWKQLTPWRIPLALWLAAGTISVITAAVNGFDAIAALGLFRAYFIEPIIVFAIGLDLIRDDKDRTALLRNITAVAILLTGYAVVQYATGWGIPHPWDAWPGRRSTGPFPFPNALALLLVPFGALAAARFVNKRTAFDAILFCCVALSSLLAQSDGGLIALAAALGLALLFKKQTRIPVIILGVILAATAFSLTPIREKILFQEWSGKVRLVIWEESTALIKHNPVFGAGLAAYPQAILPYHTATWMEVFQYPHNILLNLWSETGLLGVIAFAALLITWARTAKNPALVLPIILALLVHGLVDVPYFKNDLAIAFFLLILLTNQTKPTTIATR
jgi:hypothetical protein